MVNLKDSLHSILTNISTNPVNKISKDSITSTPNKTIQFKRKCTRDSTLSRILTTYAEYAEDEMESDIDSPSRDIVIDHNETPSM